jgi:hypothetical protein
MENSVDPDHTADLSHIEHKPDFVTFCHNYYLAEEDSTLSHT